jgi:hypothetical protein
MDTEPLKRVPGFAARTWGAVMFALLGLATVVMVVLVGWMLATQTVLLNPVGATLFLIAGIAYLATYLAYRRIAAQREREIAAGYTTLVAGPMELPEVDVRTNRVLRRGGEPYLDRRARRRRRRELRA